AGHDAVYASRAVKSDCVLSDLVGPVRGPLLRHRGRARALAGDRHGAARDGRGVASGGDAGGDGWGLGARMSWELGSTALVAVALGAGIAWYERSRPPSRLVALVAALAGLALAGRVL